MDSYIDKNLFALLYSLNLEWGGSQYKCHIMIMHLLIYKDIAWQKFEMTLLLT